MDDSLLSPALTCISSIPSPTCPGTPVGPLAVSPGVQLLSMSRRPSTPRDVGASFNVPPPLRLPKGVKTAPQIYDEQAGLVVRIETEVVVVVDADLA